MEELAATSDTWISVCGRRERGHGGCKARVAGRTAEEVLTSVVRVRLQRCQHGSGAGTGQYVCKGLVGHASLSVPRERLGSTMHFEAVLPGATGTVQAPK